MGFPALPRIGVKHLRAVGAQAGYRSRLFGGVVIPRSGRGMGGFREDADHVVEIRRGTHTTVPPHTEVGGRNSPRHTEHGKPVGHSRPDEVHSAGYPWVYIGVDRTAKWRNENTRPGRRSLVVVMDDLGIPFLVKHLIHRFGLRHIAHKPIPVVVVPHVFLIQNRG